MALVNKVDDDYSHQGIYGTIQMAQMYHHLLANLWCNSKSVKTPLGVLKIPTQHFSSWCQSGPSTATNHYMFQFHYDILFDKYRNRRCELCSRMMFPPSYQRPDLRMVTEWAAAT